MSEVRSCRSEIATFAVIATVTEGEIQDLETSCPQAVEASEMLQMLFEVDSRYRVIWEIGVGANTQMEVIQANRSPNESYGHKNGAIHWGLGLTPWTQYHIDIICPNTVIVNEKGEILAGGDTCYKRGRSSLLREIHLKEKTGIIGCPCIA